MRLVELQHEPLPLALPELIHAARVPEAAEADERRFVPADAVLVGDEPDDGGVDGAEAGGVVYACEGEGRVEGLFDLLDAADAGVDARAALEREDVTRAGAVIEDVEVNAQGIGNGGAGEGVRRGVEEEVALGVIAERAVRGGRVLAHGRGSGDFFRACRR